MCSAAAARDIRCRNFPESTKTTASDLSKIVSSAQSSINSDYRRDVFTGVPELETPQGRKNLGEVWSDYLSRNGYPQKLDELQCIASDLMALGLDAAAADVLVSRMAHKVAVHHLVTELNFLSNQPNK